MSQGRQPDPERLIERLQIGLPLIGFYDAPEPALCPDERSFLYRPFLERLKTARGGHI